MGISDPDDYTEVIRVTPYINQEISRCILEYQRDPQTHREAFRRMWEYNQLLEEENQTSYPECDERLDQQDGVCDKSEEEEEEEEEYDDDDDDVD